MNHIYNPHNNCIPYSGIPLTIPYTNTSDLTNITISDTYFLNDKIAALKADYMGNCFSTHFIALFSHFLYNKFTPFDVYQYTQDDFNIVQIFLFYLVKHDLIRCDEDGLRIVYIDVLTIKGVDMPLPENPPANTANKVKFLEDSILFLEQQAAITESLTEKETLYNAIAAMIDAAKNLLTIDINALAAKVTALETTTAEQTTKITALETLTADQTAKITALETAKADFETRIAALEANP